MRGLWVSSEPRVRKGQANEEVEEEIGGRRRSWEDVDRKEEEEEDEEENNDDEEEEDREGDCRRGVVPTEGTVRNGEEETTAVDTPGFLCG